jgi:rieske iron-sulfur protein
MVGLLAASGLAGIVGHHGASAAAPAKSPPQAGDELVFAEGELKGEPVTATAVPLGGPLAGAWAKDPATGTVRSGSRLYRVLLVRLDPAALDAKTRARAADGIVAYSGFCTHAGCPIQHWKAAEQAFYCHCHSSQFDPRAGGRVVNGPARRPLAGLPLRLEGDRLVVAGEFVGKLGVPKT